MCGWLIICVELWWAEGRVGGDSSRAKTTVWVACTDRCSLYVTHCWLCCHWRSH